MRTPNVRPPNAVPHWIVLGTLAIIVIAGVSACSRPSPSDALQTFADALGRRDAAAAAAVTDQPDAARSAVQKMFDGMGTRARPAVTATLVDDKLVTATLAYRWDLGRGHTAAYTSTVTLRQIDSVWRITWAPSVLHPELRGGQTFSYSDDMRYDTHVLDRHGASVMTWQTLHVVTLTRNHLESAEALAAALRRVDPGVTAASIRQSFGTAGDRATVIRLRVSDYAQVRGALEAIAGVSVAEQGALLRASRSLRSPAIAGLEDAWRTHIAATAGWSVSLVNDDGTVAVAVAGDPAGPTAPLRTGLDLDIQRSAQAAVERQRKPTMIVAIAPSTGDIVAVAQNSAADSSGPVALTGLYPPGSTFKTITTAAALSHGIATPDTVLPCPGRATIEGRTIPNENEFDLGSVSLTNAFARSCNTTMGSLANRLPANALPTTAKLFGIGVDYTIPGITTVTGSVPDADSPAQRVENGIGQGTVTASPFGLAVAEASLAHGSTITPRLIGGTQTTADTASQTLPTNVVADLRAMMRQTVTVGTARSLSNIPGLGGKTGTAEYGDNRNPHSWFAGIVGDLAFATLVVGGGSSDAALPVTGAFLSPLAMR